MRALARRLLAVEAGRSTAATPARAADEVLQKLRVYLTRIIGPDGFRALKRRAVMLAAAEFPSLRSVDLDANGAVPDVIDLDGEGEIAIAIIAHLLELLIVLIGESLTLRLIRDAFPDASGPPIGEVQDIS